MRTQLETVKKRIEQDRTIEEPMRFWASEGRILIFATGSPQDKERHNTSGVGRRIRMTRHDLESVALTLVSEGKEILAADEPSPL